MSAIPETRSGTRETIADLLATLSIFASLIALAYRPGRVIPFAVLLALIAVALRGRDARLAAFALGVGAVCFVVGMSLAVITNNPIY